MAAVSSRVWDVPDYVRAFAADSPAIRVSTEPAITPYWSSDGRQILFKSMNVLKMASFRGDGNRPEIGVPQALFDLPAIMGVLRHRSRWPLSRDPPGRTGTSTRRSRRVNWFRESRERAGQVA